VVRRAIESASRFAVKSLRRISSNDAKAICPDHLAEKGGFKRRAADGLPGEFAPLCAVRRAKNFTTPRCFPILAALLFDP
jgi:hypothetical protein